MNQRLFCVVVFFQMECALKTFLFPDCVIHIEIIIKIGIIIPMITDLKIE